MDTVLKMMNSSALSAKIHAMRGKALSDSDYDNLMGMRTIPMVAAYLIDNTSYAAAFEGVSPIELHRAKLERLLRENLRDDIRRLKPFMSRGAKQFSQVITLGEGIEKIKIILRLISIGHPENIGEYMRHIPGSKGILPIARFDNIDQFICYMEGTPYFVALKIFLHHPERQSLFRMEMALDSYWARLVSKYAKKYLNGDEAKAVIKIYGMEFDLENLTFLLRCKKNFDMTEDEIIASVIPAYYKLKKDTILKIVKSPSYEAAVAVIDEETPYGQAFSQEDRFIEKRQKEYLAKKMKRSVQNNSCSIQAPIAYIHMRRQETNNIVSIIEGIRYGLTPDKIKTYLVGYGSEGVMI